MLEVAETVTELSVVLRIAYLITSLEIGGSERQLAALLKGLPGNTYEKHVICLSGFGELEGEVRQHVAALYDLRWPRLRKHGKLQPRRMPAAAATLPRLVKLLRQIRPDVFHTMIPVCNVMGAVAGRLARVPHLVCTRLSLGDYRDKNRVLARLENLTDSSFELVHCKSEGIRDDVARREPIDIDRMRVVYNGIRTAAYYRKAPVPELLADLGIPRDAKVLGSVANLHTYKGHLDILAAAPEILSKVPDAYFLFVGRDAGAGADIQAEAAKLNIRDRVILTGQREDVPQLLQCMHVFVLASHEEGFSNAILEAMASALPVVATRVGGNGEAVLDQSTGFLVPPRQPAAIAEAVVPLLANAQLAADMGARGRKRVAEKFSYEAMIHGMQRFYAEVAGERV